MLIANDAGNPNYYGAAHCPTTPARVVSGPRVKVFRASSAIAQRPPFSSSLARCREEEGAGRSTGFTHGAVRGPSDDQCWGLRQRLSRFW